jgi:hypothetical protein
MDCHPAGRNTSVQLTFARPCTRIEAQAHPRRYRCVFGISRRRLPDRGRRRRKTSCTARCCYKRWLFATARHETRGGTAQKKRLILPALQQTLCSFQETENLDIRQVRHVLICAYRDGVGFITAEFPNRRAAVRKCPAAFSMAVAKERPSACGAERPSVP